MKHNVFSIIIFCLLFSFTACPGGDSQPGPSLSGEKSPELRGNEGGTSGKKGQKTREELLTQLLNIQGVDGLAIFVNNQISVQYSQSPVESAMDVLLTWHTIALGALDVYGPEYECSILQLIKGNPEIMITLPLSKVSDFREEKISFEEYRKVFQITFLNNPL